MSDTPLPVDQARVTRLLEAATAGEPRAAVDLLPLVYEDLRRLASARMARMAPGQTLQATSLVHEAYVRLVGSRDPGWKGRAHFFGAAARAMRNVLADHLEAKASLKRGGHLRRSPGITSVEVSVEGPSDEVLAVEEALQVFEREYPRKAEVVTLTYFGGMTHDEVAAALDLSTRTVERDWRFAKAWLNARLSGEEA